MEFTIVQWYIDVALFGGFLFSIYVNYKAIKYIKSTMQRWRKEHKLRKENKQMYQ